MEPGAFPPYRLLDRDYLQAAQQKLGRVERLYHVGHRHAWDGKQLLADLRGQFAPSGTLDIPPLKRQALAAIFTPIMWGELAAWNVAADLALHLTDVEAKMAATGQTFDEARHFYVLRDYLLLLGCDLPPLDGFAQTVLRDLLESDSLLEKLVGMQLIVENTAVVLFRAVAKAQVEPVLSALLPYLERDEARHVGLGVLYAPGILQSVSALEAARLGWLQFKIATLLGWSTQRNRYHMAQLGIDAHESFRLGMRLQSEMVERMRHENHGKSVRGVMFGNQAIDRFNDVAIELFFPPVASEPELPWWHRGVIHLCDAVARRTETLLRS